MKVLLCIAIITIILLLTRFINFDERVYTRSTVDSQLYLVRNTKNKVESADTLARLNNKVKQLLNVLDQDNNKEFLPAIKRLQKRYTRESLSEGSLDRNFTTYTVNKGESVTICLRTRDDRDQLYNDNLLFYILLHENAHIMSVSVGHGDESKRNFEFLKTIAEKYGLFQRVSKQVEYCGISTSLD